MVKIEHHTSLRMKSKISNREREIIDLIAQEYCVREIATLLFISEHTVTSHRKNIMRKLEVKNTAGLIRRCFETGILKLCEPELNFTKSSF